MPSYKFPTATEEDPIDVWESQSTHRDKIEFERVREVVNLQALEERARAGPEVSGETRQAQLQAYIQTIRSEGGPVEVRDDTVTDKPCSPIWALFRLYSVLDGFGAAFLQGAGIQNITKGARTDCLRDLPSGEYDLVEQYSASYCDYASWSVPRNSNRIFFL